jgi:glutathione S-transferase
MLTVWGRKTSSNVQALMWCIGELGLPYERHDAGHRYGGNDTPAFLGMNPNGTVPVLRDGLGAKLDMLLDIAAAQLSRGAFLAGDQLTLADIQFGHVLFRYFDIPIARPHRPALTRYYDALVARPAFREHVMVPYEELRVSG